MPQEERAAKAADDTTGEPAAKDSEHSGEDSH